MAMTKNLETVDRIAKLTLSVLTLGFYAVGVIDGPFAKALMIVSVAALVISFAKVVFLKNA
jgi:hypothetical protein